MSLEEITDVLEVLSADFAKLTHLIQKLAEKGDEEPEKVEPTNNFKLLIVGDTGVGKSTFVKRHLTGDFDPKYIPTLGVDVNPVRFKTNYGNICFNLWDCSGNENSGLGDGYYCEASAAIVMYDCTNPKGMQSVHKWIKSIQRLHPNIPIVVVGNKIDATGFGALRDNVWEIDLKHYYVSAKSNYNYTEPFLYIAKKLWKRNDLKFE